MSATCAALRRLSIALAKLEVAFESAPAAFKERWQDVVVEAVDECDALAQSHDCGKEVPNGS